YLPRFSGASGDRVPDLHPRAPDLPRLARDPRGQAVEAGQLRVDRRLAVRQHRDRERPLRIGPGDDVREAEVAERVLGVAPVEAQHLGAEHDAVAEPGWEP